MSLQTKTSTLSRRVTYLEVTSRPLTMTGLVHQKLQALTEDISVQVDST